MILAWAQQNMARGFSRRHILELLKEQSCTGGEIIDHAKQGDGPKPPSGVIYSLLGRLLDEGLVAESAGKYSLTKKGKETAHDVGKMHDAVSGHLDALSRLGNVGQFVAMDLVEKMSTCKILGHAMTGEDELEYKRFLESELARIRGREITID